MKESIRILNLTEIPVKNLSTILRIKNSAVLAITKAINPTVVRFQSISWSIIFANLNKYRTLIANAKAQYERLNRSEQEAIDDNNF